MKVVLVDRVGKETLICESIDRTHGEIVVKLLNGNYSTKNKKAKYKLVEMEYVMNESLEDQMVMSLEYDS